MDPKSQAVTDADNDRLWELADEELDRREPAKSSVRTAICQANCYSYARA